MCPALGLTSPYPRSPATVARRPSPAGRRPTASPTPGGRRTSGGCRPPRAARAGWGEEGRQPGGPPVPRRPGRCEQPRELWVVEFDRREVVRLEVVGVRA